jgi:hypothetical protein
VFLLSIKVVPGIEQFVDRPPKFHSGLNGVDKQYGASSVFCCDLFCEPNAVSSILTDRFPDDEHQVILVEIKRLEDILSIHFA